MAEPLLLEVLRALGFTERDRIPICTRRPGGDFVSMLYAVRDLAGWMPPQDRDVWFGANPVGRHVSASKKGGEADVTRMRTLFADLDVKPGKCLDSLEQCYAAVGGLAEYVDAEPAVLIESGHGLQPLWRVGSPPGDSNVIDRDWPRQEFRETWWRFGAVVQRAVQDATWAPDGSQNTRMVDGVFNIDRVLRCPGSINWKNPEEPVPVRTRLVAGADRLMMHSLVSRLDRDGIKPLRSTREIRTGRTTDFDAATEWIESQNEATLDLSELRALRNVRSLNTVLWEYLDQAKLVGVIADGNEGAHAEMRDRVLHAVYSAQEGRAGLVVALHNIGEAYLKVMELRARGDLPGEARDTATATREWASAVRGAVARARGRDVPRINGWGHWPSMPKRPRGPRRPRSGRRP
uniref:Uncharacterized protein n=1 Tax=Mycolicibacterium gilvum (strain PYR-GCK) TaxID=350054 RepID=A4T6J1_MYCGI|nr:hypothetical protein Mflv_1980 [Mycolicibacterium gilvum PYR-GCK]